MSPASRPRLVCRCRGVASPRIYAAARDGAIASVGDVTKVLGAGGGCTLCHPEIEEILAEVAGVPVDPGVALENEAICRHETRAAVERAITGPLRTPLARVGARVEAVDVEGLCVRVRLSAASHADAARIVRDTLTARVCPDLDVHVTTDTPACERAGPQAR